jgi:ABC-type histidine transport system ATPase subunit
LLIGVTSLLAFCQGGERRLLEISRALVMQPQVLLVDEPSIGLEPRFIDMVFEILDDLAEEGWQNHHHGRAKCEEGPCLC